MPDRKSQKHRNDHNLMTIVNLWPYLTPYQRSMLTIHAISLFVLAKLRPPQPLRPRHLVIPVMFSQIAVFVIAVNLPFSQAITFGTVGNILIAALAISPSIRQGGIT
jgi:hypothetical protein